MTATRPESILTDKDRSIGEALDAESLSRPSAYNVPACKPAALERVYHCNDANLQRKRTRVRLEAFVGAGQRIQMKSGTVAYSNVCRPRETNSSAKPASTRPRQIPRLMSLLPSRFRTIVLSMLLVLEAVPVCLGQQSAPQNIPPEPEHKRIFGIIPNYRTYPALSDYQPITPRDKFKIAVEDSFDRGTVILAAAFAGQRQLTNNTPAFGQGVAGYARYFGAAYTDLVIGNFMTEAIYPVSLHEDPRYFRRGTGSGWSRVGYAMTRIFWTRMDSGGHQFNFSEVVGNSTAVAISSAYYPDNRTAGAAISSLAVQLGLDMAGNFLKEFWPDLGRKLSRKHKATSP